MKISSVLALLGVIVSSSPALSVIDCENEPNLARRIEESTLIVVGEIVSREPRHLTVDSTPEAGKFYGPERVRVGVRVDDVLKGHGASHVEFGYEEPILELNGCVGLHAKSGMKAVFFLSGTGPSYSIVGGAYGVDQRADAGGLDQLVKAIRKQIPERSVK